MKIKGIEEQKLIDRLIEGDKTAFELLFYFYYPGLLVFAKSILLDADEAENVVQDFFVHLWMDRKKIRNTKTLKGYFFTSVKNKSLNIVKSKKIKENTFHEFRQMIENDSLYEPDLFVESDLQNRISRILEKLPPRTREVFVLSRREGLSNDEIAGKLNISKRTVETQISNALRLLRVELKDLLFLLIILGIDLYR